MTEVHLLDASPAVSDALVPSLGRRGLTVVRQGWSVPSRHPVKAASLVLVPPLHPAVSRSDPPAPDSPGAWLDDATTLAERWVEVAGPDQRLVVLVASAGLGGTACTPTEMALHAALGGMVRSVAVAVARRGATANAVAVGRLDDPDSRAATQRGPGTVGPATGRGPTAYQVAAALTFLLSPQASLVNGVTIPVDGGLTSAVIGF